MELLMQYVWQLGVFGRGKVTAVDGRCVEVIDRGTLNTGPGPDFFNAKVRVDGQLWAGNVELHVRASDWFRHGHQSDRAYGNVVLHVVAVDDAEVCINGRDEPVPQIVMGDVRRYQEFYDRLLNRDMPTLGCAPELRHLTSIEVAEWLACLGYARLQRKADAIADMVDHLRGDWSETSYIILARGLGFGTNADAMERVARAMPLRLLGRHSDSLRLVEAMLLGQAGLLEPQACGLDDGHYADDYHRYLLDQYRFFRTKFSLDGPLAPGWRTGGLRPGNSPWRRVAMLAQYVCLGLAGGSRLMEVTDLDAMLGVLDVELGEYWQKHWRPGAEAPYTHRLSMSSRRLLLVNVVIPLIYARAEHTGRYDLTAAYADMLQQLEPEDNRIIRLFAQTGLPARDALESQALIELYNEYCTRRRCVSCRFAHRLLARRIAAH